VARCQLLEALRSQDAVENIGHTTIRVEEVGDGQTEVGVGLVEGFVAEGEGIDGVDLGAEGPGGLELILDGHADDRDVRVLPGKGGEVRHLLAAGDTPGGPEIDDQRSPVVGDVLGE
jgi:hypothetical protein